LYFFNSSQPRQILSPFFSIFVMFLEGVVLKSIWTNSRKHFYIFLL